MKKIFTKFFTKPIETKVQTRIHVKTLDGEEIYGSLNIGKLTKTDQDGVYLISTRDNKSVAVTCDDEMVRRINDRLSWLEFIQLNSRI